MDEVPTTDASADPPTGRARPPAAIFVGAGILLALTVLLVVNLAGRDAAEDGDVDGSDHPAEGTTDIEVEGPPTSAATGADGTRELDVVPDDLPPGLVTEDATEVEGTVARSGDDWSAAVVYATPASRAEAESVVEQAVSTAGFTRTRASTDPASKVLFYTGADGATLTVTLAGPEAGPLTIGAVLVSP